MFSIIFLGPSFLEIELLGQLHGYTYLCKPNYFPKMIALIYTLPLCKHRILIGVYSITDFQGYYN